MKAYYSRIFALIVMATLIIAGYLTMLPNPSKTLENETEEAMDDQDFFTSVSLVPRGTRAGESWPLYRCDLPNSGFTTSTVPDDNSILWSNTTEGTGSTIEAYGSPVIAYGKVFFGSRDGHLYCFDLNTGERIWRTFLSTGDYSICGSPGVANDHVVIFSAGDDNVYRLRVSDGGINWTFNPPGGGSYGSSSPAIYNGRVYVGSGNRNLYCLDEITGNMIWSYTTGPGPVNNYGIQSSPAVANGRVFIGACDTYLYCFNESQPSAPAAQYYWRTNLFDAIYASPAVANGRVYCGSGYYTYSQGTGSHTMFCMDELTGAVIWSYVTGSDILSSPAIAYGNCYFTSTDGELYCVDAMSAGPTPTLYWSNTTGDTWSSPAVSNGKVVVGSRGNNRIYCFNATAGEQIWFYNAGDDVYSSPAIADGKVVVSVRGNPESVVCFAPSLGIDYIQIRDAPNDGGYVVNMATYSVWETDEFYAAAYNISTGYLYDVSVTWDSDDTGVGQVTTPGTMTTFTAQEVATDSTCNVTADYGGIGNSTGLLTVLAPTVDYIQIRDAASGAGSIVTTRTYYPLDTDSFYAAAYNYTADYLYDVSVTWSSDDPGVGQVTSPGTSTTFTAQQVAVDSTCNVTADYGGIGNSTGLLTVLAPTVDYIQIRDAAIGAGFIVTTRTYYILDIDSFYAAAYNYTFDYLYDVSVTWDSDDPGVGQVTTPGASTSFTAQEVAMDSTCTVTATYNSISNSTGLLSVLYPRTDYVQIRTAVGGGGIDLCDPANYQSYPVGYSITFYGALHNLSAGYIDEVNISSTWDSSDPAIVNATTLGNYSTITCNTTDWGTVTITLDDDGISNTTQVTVLEPTIDYIVISTAPGGGGSWVGNTTYIFGDTDTFYAAGHNETAGWIRDVNASWSSDNSTIGSVDPDPSNSTIFNALNNGTCSITAQNGTLSNDTGVITIINFTVDYILIRDSPGNSGALVGDRTFSIGDTTNFYAAAYNTSAPGLYLGDVPVEWVSSDNSIARVTTPGSSTEFTIQFRGGECDVTATYALSVSDVTGALTVLPPSVDYIVITNAPNGAEITTVYLDVGETLFIHASGYNNTGPTYTGLVEADWEQSLTIGSLNPLQAGSTTFTAGISGGLTTITATYAPSSLSDDFTLIVNSPTTDYIQITDSAGGLGNIITTRTYSVNQVDIFYAAAHNYSVGYLRNVEANWYSDNSSVGQVTSPGLWTFFTAQKVTNNATCNVTADYQGLSDSTGILTVLVPIIDYIQIRDAPNGEGNIISTAIFNEGETATYHVAAYNHSADYLEDIPGAEWSNDIGTLAPTTGGNTTYTATSAGTGSITVSYGGITNSTTITINDVTPPSQPGQPTVTLIGGDEVEIALPADPPSDVEEYVIQRSTSQGGPWVNVTTVGRETYSFIDTGLEPDTTYYYRIIAVDSASNPSSPSPVSSVTTPAPGQVTEKGSPVLLLVLLIVMILIIVLILLFALTKRRKPEELPMPQEVKREGLPPPPTDIAEKELPPPPEDELPPPPEEEMAEEELPPPPEDEVPEEELPPPPEDEDLPPPPED